MNTTSAEPAVEFEVAQPAANGTLVPRPAPTGSLAAGYAPAAPPVRLSAALAKAQQKCKAVPHDARNEHHKYNYTSAEAIITEAKQALADSGLALVPVELTVDGWQREGAGEDRFELRRRFLLMHTESGECLPLVCNWPICPERGRPLDKAAAISDTVSLAYLLRDLLLMPRVDRADDLPGRDDRPQRQSPATKKRPPPEPAPADAPRIDEAQKAELERLIKESGASVRKLLEYYAVPVLVKLPQAHFADAVALLRRKIAEKQGQQPADPASSAAPASTPQQGAPSATADPKPGGRTYASLVREAHRLIEAKGRTWRAALLWSGVEPPAGFEEPRDADAAEFAIDEELLTRERVEKLLQKMMPKGK